MASDPDALTQQKWRVGQIWDAPHRPLFLASFLSALLAVAWWPLGTALGLPVSVLGSTVLWHIHELLFGFVSAAVGGYLLTALPSWTGRQPLQGKALKLLVALWVLARVTTAFVDALPLLIIANSGYFLMLATVLTYQIQSARSYYKLGYGVVVLLLGMSEALFLTAAVTGRHWLSLTLAHTIVIGITLLVITIAAAAIPAFTNNWLVRTERADRKIKDFPIRLLLAQGLVAIAMMGKLAGWPDLTHVVLICAALTLFWIMCGWRVLAVLSNPLLAALQLAFLWVPVGLFVIGLAGFFPSFYPQGDAIHSLTIGAMSGLIMAIAGRAASHHHSGDLKAPLSFIIGVTMIWISTGIRLTWPLFPNYNSVILAAAAIFWCVAWMSFIAGFLPAMFGPVIRPVLSGKRHQSTDSPIDWAEKDIQ